MAVTGIGSAGVSYGKVITYRNPTTQVSHDITQSGTASNSVARYNNLYDVAAMPFGLGSGVGVKTTGRYLMGTEQKPVAKFLVINDGNSDIYAGINIDASGNWTKPKGLAIPSGQSYEFGALGTEVIRNVWALSEAGTQRVQGYATNLVRLI